ncbi:hypothetical protein GCM10020256_72260 [Streptomyces thermocoprophilus]
MRGVPPGYPERVIVTTEGCLQVRTVGVEEELLLVDPDSGEPKALAAAALARAEQDDTSVEVFEKELYDQMLEFATRPQSGMAELRAEIGRCRREAARHARDTGCAVAALATSPLPVGPSFAVGRRYRWMAEQYGVSTRLVCGCHVHVSVDGDEEGVAVVDRVRPWLPVLTALSANSPFWQGRDTAYNSYRSQVWSRWPSAGPVEVFGSVQAYRRQVADMVATGTVLDEAMVYYDVRLSARYPTVEFRVADVCLDADGAVLLAMLARALVETAAREWQEGRGPAPHTVSLLRLASWRAARSGLTGGAAASGDPASGAGAGRRGGAAGTRGGGARRQRGSGDGPGVERVAAAGGQQGRRCSAGCTGRRTACARSSPSACGGRWCERDVTGGFTACFGPAAQNRSRTGTSSAHHASVRSFLGYIRQPSTTEPDGTVTARTHQEQRMRDFALAPPAVSP